VSSDGCGSTHAVGSYGSAFNDAKGGVYATWLESDALRIYWFPREKIPSDIKAGKPDPTKWGKPASKFLSGPGCDVGKYFKGQTIVSTMAKDDNLQHANKSRSSTLLSVEITLIRILGMKSARPLPVQRLVMTTSRITLGLSAVHTGYSTLSSFTNKPFKG
jgi:hypothetical protein